jgi:hypothetical protein
LVEPPHLSAPARQKMQEDSLMGNECVLCYCSSDHNQYINSHPSGCYDHPLIYTANNALSHIFPFHLQISVIPQSMWWVKIAIVTVHTYIFHFTVAPVYEENSTASI